MTDNVNENGERGLVPVSRRTYMAPGGDYTRLTFEHVENCKCGDEASDDHIRMIIRNGGFETFEQVEAAIKGILLTRGCFECRFDRRSTLGMYVRQHSADDSSFGPSSGNLVWDSQTTDGGTHLTPKMLEQPVHPDQASISWPSVANDSQSAQRVAADDAPQADSQLSSSYDGSGLPSSIMRRLSPGEQRMYGPGFQLDHASDVTYRPSGDVSSPAIGSGFRSESFSQHIPEVRPAVPMSRAHVRFAGRVKAVVPPLVERTPSPRDVPMNLGSSKNTNGSGMGDSKHAIPESSVLSQIVSVPPTASSVTTDMIDALNDITAGRAQSPVSESSEYSHINISEVRFEAKDGYKNIDDVIDDLRLLGRSHNKPTEVLDRALGTIVSLESRESRNCRRIEELEDIIDNKRCEEQASGPAMRTIGKKNEPREKNKNPTSGVKGPAPPIPLRINTVSGPAACVTNIWTEVVKRNNKVIPTGKLVNPPSRNTKQQSAIPNLIPARDRYLTMRFATRNNVVLPEGCSTEAIRARINSFFTNRAKIGSGHPYLKEARLRRDIGCIYMTLADHSADDIYGMLAGCHTVLLRDLNLPDFMFEKDTKKVKILVLGIPLCDTGRGSLWKVEDWTGDKVYDGLRVDLEQSNPGIITSGRPNIIGSINAMKSNKMTMCQVQFMAEKWKELDAAVNAGRICLRGGNRACRIWTEHKPATVCSKCQLIGYIQTMCSTQPRCRLCRGGHWTREHMCSVLNCPGETGESCEHTIRACFLCESSGHFTGYNKCPALRSTPDTGIPDTKHSPITADETSYTEVNDESRNRGRRNRRGWKGETLIQAQLDEINKGTGSAKIPSVKVDRVRNDKNHSKEVVVLPAPGLNKDPRIMEYENSGPSGLRAGPRKGRKADDKGKAVCEDVDADDIFGDEICGRPSTAPPRSN
ncbi:hypothetical protein B9Z19DRAFT_1067880 [Tuber borchii]|uniref:Uncharacterized protein n=1 Tax=Tuber borchii TaxID=42251 RepID=A0A2T6ZH81_TUBBO|nr:hypothetical protein B9Z19DRAFT_1067880 [Tuber borchii]